MATAPARIKIELTAQVRQAINALADAKVASLLVGGIGEPTGDPNPIFDDLKAERARLWAADQLEADAQDVGWWRRGQLLREARELRGGVL